MYGTKKQVTGKVQSGKEVVRKWYGNGMGMVWEKLGKSKGEKRRMKRDFSKNNVFLEKGTLI